MPETRLIHSHSYMNLEDIGRAMNELNLIMADIQNSICNLRVDMAKEKPMPFPMEGKDYGKKMDKGAARRTVKKN
tara:strand:+ start:182 stop:406 length:225 start_codon:yes stop_codon:yes gene_type:complete